MVHACRSGEPLARAWVLGSDATAWSSRSLALSKVVGSLRLWAMMLGYASDANRYGRGIRSAVSASGSSSHDLSLDKPLSSILFHSQGYIRWRRRRCFLYRREAKLSSFCALSRWGSTQVGFPSRSTSRPPTHEWLKRIGRVSRIGAVVGMIVRIMAVLAVW